MITFAIRAVIGIILWMIMRKGVNSLHSLIRNHLFPVPDLDSAKSAIAALPAYVPAAPTTSPARTTATTAAQAEANPVEAYRNEITRMLRNKYPECDPAVVNAAVTEANLRDTEPDADAWAWPLCRTIAESVAKATGFPSDIAVSLASPVIVGDRLRTAAYISLIINAGKQWETCSASATKQEFREAAWLLHRKSKPLKHIPMYINAARQAFPENPAHALEQALWDDNFWIPLSLRTA